MWDDIIKIITQVLASAGSAAVGSAVSGAFAPDAPSGGGSGPMSMGAPASPVPMGAGSATRPSNMNFTGGFTGNPPGTVKQGGEMDKSPGFTTIDKRLKPKTGYESI